MEVARDDSDDIDAFLDRTDEEVLRLFFMFDRISAVGCAHEFLATEPRLFEMIVGEYMAQTQQYAAEIAGRILIVKDEAEELMSKVEAQIDEVFRDESTAKLLKMGLLMGVARSLAELSGKPGYDFEAIDQVSEGIVDPEVVARILGSAPEVNARFLQIILDHKLQELDSDRDLSQPGGFAAGIYIHSEDLRGFWKEVVLEMVEGMKD